MRGPGCGRDGGDVGGEACQVGVRPRGQRPARPRVKFVLGQAAMDERNL
jgi:hypothetical protein